MTTLGRRLTVAALAIGLGLVAAPAVFQMFSRAPKGGHMIDGFRPYMTETKIDAFRGYLSTIDRAHRDVTGALLPDAAHALGVPPEEVARRFPAVADFTRRWPGINADMGDMLRTMRTDLGDYKAVAALPPFPLFPWFFVLPGIALAVVAGRTLVRDRRGRPARGHLTTLAVVGVALVAAPAVFGLFTRAPRGGHMIDDFRPLMTQAKVTRVQGYFLTIAGGEGAIRTQVLPALGAGALSRYHDLAAFLPEWPHISNEFAPMIGAMSDNLPNYAAVAALPPFPLFPWFFVVPGVLVAAFALVARRDAAIAAATTAAASTTTAPAATDAAPAVTQGRNR